MTTLLKLDCQDNAASTAVVDSSGSGNNGVLTNAGNTSAVSVLDGPGTYLTRSLALNASDTNDLVLVTVTRSGTASNSEGWWFKATSASSSANIRKMTGSNPDAFGSHWNHTNGTYIRAGYRGGTFPAASFGTVPHAEWHHYALTWDGTTLKAYLDGALITPTATAATLGNAATVSLGNNPAGTQGADGRYCGWRIDEGVAWDATAIAAIIAEKDLPTPETSIEAGTIRPSAAASLTSSIFSPGGVPLNF